MSDLISRQDVIDALQKEINKGIPPFDDVMGSIRCGVRLARNIIEDLPSTQPRKGLWIDIKHTFMTKCSVCDWINNDDSSYNFCPRCGADMRPQFEEEKELTGGR